jgi:EAL domain-containing protein (putative c-di-GMP-specific phosphodiesterase class I)
MFVSIAEESGTIGRLGEFVLEQAMSDTQSWLQRRLVGPDFAVHVNVSHMQLASASFVNLVLAMLRQHRLRPDQLILEAREAALLTRNVEVERSVRALRRLGVRVAIDNFGTGANALSVLTDIGADVLKLDGSLALPSGSSDSDTRLVRAIVLLAHALNMQVVAERVSGPEQLRRLRAAGCDLVQGNLLGDPVSADRFALRANG